MNPIFRRRVKNGDKIIKLVWYTIEKLLKSRFLRLYRRVYPLSLPKIYILSPRCLMREFWGTIIGRHEKCCLNFCSVIQNVKNKHAWNFRHLVNKKFQSLKDGPDLSYQNSFLQRPAQRWIPRRSSWLWPLAMLWRPWRVGGHHNRLETGG